MIIDRINLNLLRIFESVYRTNNMTRSAIELHMTQSGVSQNIKSLEELLDLKLFDRIKQKLIPTKKAVVLYASCSKNLYELEDTLIDLTGTEKEIKGEIVLGIPIEFGNNLILPKLAEFGRVNSKVSYRIRYGHSAQMNNELLSGDLDFAFVDDFSFDSQIKTIKVHDEILELVAGPVFLKTFGQVLSSKKYFEKLDYIDYLSDGFILKSWFKHHLKATQINLNVKASLMDVVGMSQMIVHGLGAGILPLHVVRKLKKAGHKVHTFSGCGNPLKNPISVAYVEGRVMDYSVQAVFDYLLEAFKVK